MAHHRYPSPATTLLARVLEDTYCIYATTPTRYDGPPRLTGVDRLTGVVLEARVALEACREQAVRDAYQGGTTYYADTDSIHVA